MARLSKFLLPILIFTVFLNATSVYAATWEIITHGGYEAAVSAWQKVALIFSDNNYKTLALPVAVLGSIILYLSVAAKVALGGKGNLLAGWGTPFMIGLIIYMAFIIPKDSVVIYDGTLNRGPQQINNIPRGIATIAGLLNKIENGFTDIIWTASDPSTDYRIQAGGTGFTIIGNFLMGVDALPASFRATLDKYVHDCVLIELQRNGTQLNLNAIQSGQQKADFVIQESRNPALYTVSYLNSTTGDSMTCQDAGQAILNWLNNSDNVKPMAQHACQSAGYSPNDANSYNACVNTATSILATVTGNDLVDLSGNNSLTAQSALATAIQDVVTQYNPENAIKALATSQSMSSFIGMGVHANSWIPVIKETLMALAVGLTPLFAIILITPLAGRAFSIMAGMFVWLTVWGVVDAIIHSFAMEQAFNNATMLKSTDGYASGVTAMMLLPTYSQKVVAMFGAVRWFGLMLSSVITGMFLKFGGTAMAMLAGSLSGTVQSTGAAYGEKVLKNPAGLYNDAIAQTSITNAAKMTSGGLAGYMAGMTASQTGYMARQARTGQFFGAEKIAEAGFLSDVESINRGLALGTPQNAEMVGRVAGGTAVGGAIGTMQLAQLYGKTPEDLAREGKLGYNYSQYTAEGNLTKVTRGADGRFYITGVKTDLISANIKQAKQQAYQKVYDQVYSAIKDMSYDQLAKWYSKNEKYLSDGTKKQVIDSLKKLKEFERTSSSSTLHSNYMEKNGGWQVNAGADLSNPGVRGVDPKGKGPQGRLASGAGFNAGSSAGEKHQTTETDAVSSKQAIAKAFADDFIKYTDSGTKQSSGSEFADAFSNKESFNEAMKAARQYKEMETLESSISMNAMPLLIQNIGDTEFSQYGVVGPNNRYDMAVQKMITDIYKGEGGKYVNQLGDIQKKHQEQNFNPIDTSVKKEVEENVNKTYTELNNNPKNQNPNFITPPPGGEVSPTEQGPKHKGSVLQKTVKPKSPLRRR
jgi:hypothetical protein